MCSAGGETVVPDATAEVDICAGVSWHHSSALSRLVQPVPLCARAHLFCHAVVRNGLPIVSERFLCPVVSYLSEAWSLCERATTLHNPAVV